jgi:hypothetical protein
MSSNPKEKQVFSTKISAGLAVTALAVAVLGSTPVGHAAESLVFPKNSVGTVQLKKAAVARAKLGKNAVTGAKVANGSLKAADFKAGQLPAGPQGPKGDKGDKGDQGPKGDKGDPGATKVTRRSQAGPPVGAGGYSNATAHCQAGETLVGGGAVYTSVPPADPTLTWSGPDLNSASGWRVSFRNDGPGGSLTAFAYAFCAAP